MASIAAKDGEAAKATEAMVGAIATESGAEMDTVETEVGDIEMAAMDGAEMDGAGAMAMDGEAMDGEDTEVMAGAIEIRGDTTMVVGDTTTISTTMATGAGIMATIGTTIGLPATTEIGDGEDMVRHITIRVQSSTIRSHITIQVQSLTTRSRIQSTIRSRIQLFRRRISIHSLFRLCHFLRFHSRFRRLIQLRLPIRIPIQFQRPIRVMDMGLTHIRHMTSMGHRSAIFLRSVQTHTDLLHMARLHTMDITSEDLSVLGYQTCLKQQQHQACLKG